MWFRGYGNQSQSPPPDPKLPRLDIVRSWDLEAVLDQYGVPRRRKGEAATLLERVELLAAGVAHLVNVSELAREGLELAQLAEDLDEAREIAREYSIMIRRLEEVAETIADTDWTKVSFQAPGSGNTTMAPSQRRFSRPPSGPVPRSQEPRRRLRDGSDAFLSRREARAVAEALRWAARELGRRPGRGLRMPASAKIVAFGPKAVSLPALGEGEGEYVCYRTRGFPTIQIGESIDKPGLHVAIEVLPGIAAALERAKIPVRAMRAVDEGIAVFIEAVREYADGDLGVDDVLISGALYEAVKHAAAELK